ncbi:MAG: NUDIX domain-containing protein [Endozoicomonas sp. (ex Botrylloides leachii)]|nr:NUDIX domain-containing protein [Endozoicomonas sp. (ex Botrylloides leachii)]
MKLSGLGNDDVQIEKQEVLFDGFMRLSKYTLRHRLFDGGRSPLLEREAITRCPSVGVLLFDPVLHSVVLVEQFRIGPYLGNDDPWMLEVVAGISEPGEALEDVAYREVKEETNCCVERLFPIANIYLSPGGANEKIMLYCGTVDSSKAGGIYGLDEEGEDIKVHVLSFEKAYMMVLDGRICNAPAVMALQWLKLSYSEVIKSAQA